MVCIRLLRATVAKALFSLCEGADAVAVDAYEDALHESL